MNSGGRFSLRFETIARGCSALEARRGFFSRRGLFGGACASLLGLAAGGRQAAASSPAMSATLAAVVDTLVPADDLSPSAASLDIHTEILEAARQPGREGTLDILTQGTAWCEARAGHTGFAALPEERRIEFLAEAEGAVLSVAQAFFRHMRRETMRLYYARPEAVAGFAAFDGPPQPDGYPGFADPPAKAGADD